VSRFVALIYHSTHRASSASLCGPEAARFAVSFRYQFKTMLEELKKHKISLLILIDEIQKKSEEMEVFISSYQLLIREGFNITL